MKYALTKALGALMIAGMLLAGCNTETAPTSQTTLPPKTTKTVFVHTSITQNSATMDARTEYIYDENDLLREVAQYSGTSQTRLYQVENDENGNFTRWYCTVGETELAIHYEYDQQGRSIGTAYYQNNELMTRLCYSFSGDLRTSMISTMPAQNSESRTEYTYNSYGYLVRQDQFVNGSLVRYGICATDGIGRVVRVFFYLPDGTRSASAVYTYEDLTTTCTLEQEDGTVLSKTVTVHDEFGNLLESTVYDSADRVVSTEIHTWKAIEVPVDCPRASV